MLPTPLFFAQGITFSSLYPGCIAETPLFREKRPWFQKLFPLFMKYVTGGYVSMPESGERLAQVPFPSSFPFFPFFSFFHTSLFLPTPPLVFPFFLSSPACPPACPKVVSDPVCSKSGIYWSWNGGAKTVAFVNPLTNKLEGAGGSGGEIFENDQSSQVTDIAKQDKMWELSSKLVGCEWPASYKGKK